MDPTSVECTNYGRSPIHQRQISIDFDKKLLGDDAVQVWSVTLPPVCVCARARGRRAQIRVWARGNGS
jgi:hypothetical protein